MSISVKRFVLGDISTNTYVVTDDISGDCAVVDPATEDRGLLEYLKDKNVKYILLTHGHFDHISGVKALKDRTSAQTVIHSEDADCLYDRDKSLFSWQYPDGEQPVCRGDKTVNDGDTLPFGDGEIRVMHTPGHTKGGVCYIFTNDRVIFSGDTLFRLSAGRTDFPGGNPREELMSLSKLAELEGDYKVYPGHGEETTLEYERRNNRYVKVRK